MPRSAHRRSAEPAVAPGRAACRRRVRAPGAGARTGKTASASGVTTGATVWNTRLSVSFRLRRPTAQPQPEAVAAGPLKEVAGLRGAHSSSQPRAAQASARLSGAGAHGRGTGSFMLTRRTHLHTPRSRMHATAAPASGATRVSWCAHPTDCSAPQAPPSLSSTPSPKDLPRGPSLYR